MARTKKENTTQFTPRKVQLYQNKHTTTIKYST